MFKTIKGYIRRLTTIKKDKTIQVDMPEYGEFEATFIHSCIINGNNNFSNIIIELTYDTSKDSINVLADKLKSLLSICGIKFITESIVSNIAHLFIGGSVYQYDKLISIYYYNPDYRYNKLLCILKNLIDKVDICRYIDQNTNEVTVYQSESIGAKNYEIYMQNISSVVSPEVIDKIYPLLLVTVYHDSYEGHIISIYNLMDFLFMYYYGDMDESIRTTINNHKSNFIIGGKKYKNIFDITFKVNDQESSSEEFNSDIDEVLD